MANPEDKEILEGTAQALETAIDTVKIAARTADNAIDGVLESLRQKGVKGTQDTTIKQGTRNIYKGKTDGSGQRAKLTSKQSDDLKTVLNNPTVSEGKVKVSVDGNEVLNSSWGQVTKDDLKISGILQKKTQAQAVGQTPRERLGSALNGPTANEKRLLETIKKLQSKVSTLENEVAQLKARPEAQSQPSPRLNDRVNNWINKQRNRVSGQLYRFGDKIATESQRQVRAGLERQSQVFTNLRSTVEQGITQSFDNARDTALKGALGAIDAAHTKAGDANQKILGNAEQAITRVVNALGNDQQVKLNEAGDRTVESRDYTHTVKSTGEVDITRKSDGTKLTASNLNDKDRKVLAGITQEADQKLKQPEPQVQEQKPKQKIVR